MTISLPSAVRAAPHGAQLRIRQNRRMKPVRPSRKDELWYKSSLLALTNDLSRCVARDLVPLLQSLEPLYTKVQDHFVDAGKMVDDRANTPGSASRIIQDRIDAMRQQFGIDGVAQRLAEAATRRVSKSVDERVANSVRQSVGVDVSGFLTRNTAMQEVMSVASKANIGLIKSIPERYFDTLGEKLTQGVEAGLRFERLADMVKQIGEVTDSRAKLIARDQVSKMNGAMTMLRQTSLGINRYTWQTAGDERVREEHAINDGQEFAWSDPPAGTGHPGQDVNCRCVACPVVNLDEDSDSGLTLGGPVGIGLAADAIGAYFGQWASAYDSGRTADAFNPDQPRDEHGRWAGVGTSLAEAAKSSKPGAVFKKHNIGGFDAGAVHAATGHDLTGYKAVADSHAIQHTMKRHGSPAEAKRGQKPIDASDFAKLPKIIARPESITALGQSRVGRDVVGFERSIDGWGYRAVMEVRTGRKELALTSLYTVGKTKK